MKEMKKYVYIRPQTGIVHLYNEAALLAASPNGGNADVSVEDLKPDDDDTELVFEEHP